MHSLIEQQGSRLPATAVQGAEWRLTDAESAARLGRMQRAGIPLGEYVQGKIYRGVLTGFNQAFVIDGAKRAALIARDARSAEIIKPLAVGKDIRKWCVDFKDRWLIVTPIGIDIQRYSAVFRHLKEWQPQLEKRYDKGRFWWELRACDYYDAFGRVKIVVPDIAKELRFAFDTTGAYTNDTTFIITSDDLYLLGVLNSSAVGSFFLEISAQVRGGYQRFKPLYFKQIPIPRPKPADLNGITELVQQCLDAGGKGPQVAEWEAEIDERVAVLYGLNAAPARAEAS